MVHILFFLRIVFFSAVAVIQSAETVLLVTELFKIWICDLSPVNLQQPPPKLHVLLAPCLCLETLETEFCYISESYLSIFCKGYLLQGYCVFSSFLLQCHITLKRASSKTIHNNLKRAISKVVFALQSVLCCRTYHLSQNYYITAPYFWTINFGRRNVIITSQKLSLNFFWAP